MHGTASQAAHSSSGKTWMGRRFMDFTSIRRKVNEAMETLGGALGVTTFQVSKVGGHLWSLLTTKFRMSRFWIT